MKILIFIVITLSYLFSFIINTENYTSISFYKSKKFLIKKYTKKCDISNYKKNEECLTIYTRCRFYREGKYFQIDFNTCNYIPTKNKRSKTIEFEHVVTASYIAKQFNLKNRMECRKDKLCRVAMSDIKNLYPCIGTINMKRYNHNYCNNIIIKNSKINEVYIYKNQKCFYIDIVLKKSLQKIILYMSNRYFKHRKY